MRGQETTTCAYVHKNGRPKAVSCGSVGIYLYARMCMRIHVKMQMYLYIHVHNVCVRLILLSFILRACIYVCIYIYTYTYMYVYICMYIIYIYTYIYIHTYIHAEGKAVARSHEAYLQTHMSCKLIYRHICRVIGIGTRLSQDVAIVKTHQ